MELKQDENLSLRFVPYSSIPCIHGTVGTGWANS